MLKEKSLEYFILLSCSSKIRFVIRVRRHCQVKYNLRSKFLTHTPTAEKIDRMGHLACDSVISARTATKFQRTQRNVDRSSPIPPHFHTFFTSSCLLCIYLAGIVVNLHDHCKYPAANNIYTNVDIGLRISD